MSEAQVLNWVVQGGSFALVVAVMAYLGYVLIPRTIAAFETMQLKFDAVILRQEERHDRELEKRDAVLERLAVSVDVLATRLERLEARTDEHRPVAADKTKSR